jgi:hypothetical protein
MVIGGVTSLIRKQMVPLSSRSLREPALLSKVAHEQASDYTVGMPVVQAYLQHAPDLDKKIPKLFEGFPQSLPVKLEKAFTKSVRVEIDKKMPEHRNTVEVLNSPPEIQERMNHAIKPEATTIIDKILQKHFATEVKDLQALNEGITKGWWPKLIYKVRSVLVLERMAEKILKKEDPDIMEMLQQVVRKPEEIERSIIAGKKEELKLAEDQLKLLKTTQQANKVPELVVNEKFR